MDKYGTRSVFRKKKKKTRYQEKKEAVMRIIIHAHGGTNE